MGEAGYVRREASRRFLYLSLAARDIRSRSLYVNRCPGEPMGKFILVRHGQSEGNALRRFTSSPDTALTELGRRQAFDAALKIKELFHPTLVIASPYFRARETARIIADVLDLAVEIEVEFREQCLGTFAGESYDTIRTHPEFDPAESWRFRPPDGESHDDVRIRSAPKLDDLARRRASEELVIVSHGGVMRALWAHAAGRWTDAHVPGNCGIVLIEHQGGRYLAPRSIGSVDDAWREAVG